MTRMETQAATRGETRQSDGGYREGARKVAREARARADDVKEKVLEEGAETRAELTEQAGSLFHDLLAAIADQIDRFGRVLRTTEETLHEERLDELASYPRQLAEGVDEVKEYLRQRSPSELRRDYERALEEAPVLVLGTLAAVGGLGAWYLRRDAAGPGDGDETEYERRKRREAVRERP